MKKFKYSLQPLAEINEIKKKTIQIHQPSSALSSVEVHDSHAVQGYDIVYTPFSKAAFSSILYVYANKDTQ